MMAHSIHHDQASNPGSPIPARRQVLGAMMAGIARHPDFLLGSALTCLGVYLRLYHLGGRSLWLDEAISAQAATLPDIHAVISWTQLDFDQMPLMALITWSTRTLGPSELALRAPSAIAGALCVGTVYALGRELLGPYVALLASLLMATLPISVWYGQEARSVGP
jgi:uncharacterized membrane protein